MGRHAPGCDRGEEVKTINVTRPDGSKVPLVTNHMITWGPTPGDPHTTTIRLTNGIQIVKESVEEIDVLFDAS